MGDAYDWYEAQRAGLGDEFLAAVDDAIAVIMDNPLRYRVLVLDTRQVLVRRFPYRLLYRVLENEIAVVACFHASRDPQRWTERD